jgi:citrate lyase beta subunit
MILSLITDDLAQAAAAEAAGIDRIMIDLEREGKAARQAGRHSFISDHQLDSVQPMKRALRSARLVVRVNPPGAGRLATEIEAVIQAGADFVMLPYFSSLEEVREFIARVRGRAGVILLVETAAAADAIASIVGEPGLDELHVGLNDLSISLRCPMFELLRNGYVERLAAVMREAGVPFGIAGVARLSAVHLPITPEYLLAEQVRLGATRAWLGRSFRTVLNSPRVAEEIGDDVQALRESIRYWQSAGADALRENRDTLARQIAAQEHGCHSPDL